MSLDEQEAFHAAIAGLMRNFHSRKRGWKHHSGDKSKVTDWGNHIESAMAEALVAKALKMFWYRVSDEPWKYADVGPYQVRHTIYFDGGLAISPKDNDDQIFILVVGAFPHQSIVGWKYAKDCKIRRYQKDELDIYIVPQDELNEGLPA